MCRANLAKHQAKVGQLREELDKEEMYVEYLEKLLSDIELHRYSVCLLLWKVKVGQLRLSCKGNTYIGRGTE
jgi:hypothetical protein